MACLLPYMIIKLVMSQNAHFLGRSVRSETQDQKDRPASFPGHQLGLLD